jgi:hypothetical protein
MTFEMPVQHSGFGVDCINIAIVAAEVDYA